MVNALESEIQMRNSNFFESDSLYRWDRVDGTTQGSRMDLETRNRENETRTSFKENEDAMSAANFKSHGPSGEDPEVSSPLKPKKEANKDGQAESKGLSPEVENNTMS